MCGRKKVFAAETIEKVPEVVVVKVWNNVNVIFTSQIHYILFLSYFFHFFLFADFFFCFNNIQFTVKDYIRIKVPTTSKTCTHVWYVCCKFAIWNPTGLNGEFVLVEFWLKFCFQFFLKVLKLNLFSFYSIFVKFIRIDRLKSIEILKKSCSTMAWCQMMDERTCKQYKKKYDIYFILTSN